MHELDLIRWIAGRARIGDDCAVLDCPPWGTLLVTTDSVIDGVHLRWGEHGPEAFGYKAVARGLSDVAAMGGEPLWTVLAACLPRDVTEEEAQAVVRGAETAGCPLVGGDTAFGPTPYVVATVLGRAHRKGPALRSNARVGDWIVVTGPLGGSLESGRHAHFPPRVREARALMDGFDVGAMIDLSDGLSSDLDHVLRASGVGARIEANAIPTNDVPLQNALNDGEDYELLCTLRPDEGVFRAVEGVRKIGTVVAGEGATLVFADGSERPLRPGGFEHGR